MIIYNQFGKEILKVTPGDESCRYRAVMGGGNVTLCYSLPEHAEIPVGSYIEYEGQRYTLFRPENVTKHGTRNFEYTVEFNDNREILKKYKFKDLSAVPHRLKFSLTAAPKTFLDLLVKNLNLRETGWTAGECIESPERVLSFNHEYCYEVLGRMADEFDTEWEIEDKKIHFRKVERYKDAPLALSYGKGNGILPGTGRANQGDKQPVTLLYVQGGERNIDYSRYGSKTLLLPKLQTFEYEGRRYKTDADGMYITRADKELVTVNEDSLDASDVYPSRAGEVTKVEVTDKGFYDFQDNTIPENLNYEDCLIAGETMTVIFQSGMLAGREFEVKYIHKERKFQIVPQEMDGIDMPGTAFCPKTGDKYAVFGCMVPDAYICDNVTKTGGSWDMFRQAARYFHEHEEAEFSFTGELDGIWAKNKWLETGGKIVPGGYVLFSDTQFQPEGILIRIVGVRDYINKPHSPQIELSNAPVGGFVSSELGKIGSNEVVTEDLHKDSVSFTKRRFRDAITSMEMLENALLNFSGSINPIAVRTMQMLAGDESLQFRFVNNKISPSAVSHKVTYNTETKVLTSPAGILQHLTLGITGISSTHKPEEYKFWDMALYNSPALTDAGKSYYLYAKVNESNSSGVFLLSQTAIALEAVAGYYHLLAGILNSEYEGERSYVELYGFTEVLPGRITTDRVVSSDGLNYLDFVNNAFRVGDSRNYLDFNTNGNGKLRLKGTLVQSESGDENFIGVYRGVYNSSYTYYAGDEVTYTVNGGTSTYRYIYSTPTKGNVPTNAAYWQITASTGSNGTDGAYYADVYRSAASQPATPTGTTLPPSNWSLTPTSPSDTNHVWMSQAKVSGTGSVGAWSTPIRISGLNGEDGADGTDVEFIYRRTTTGTTPSQPGTSQTDDYIPSGWTDSPSGVGSAYLYEWVCVRYKNAGTWTAFSTPVVWAKWGEKGTDGDGFEYIYRRTTTGTAPSQPGTSQTDDYVPANWTDNPAGVTTSYPYEWVCVRKKTDGVWSSFSSPALWAKFGQDGSNGSNGTDGAYYEYRYAVNGSRTSPPSLSTTTAAPSGWSTTMPSVGSLQYLWCTVAKKSASGTLLQNWSAPTRVTGYDGQDGADGATGNKGDYISLVFKQSASQPATPTGTSPIPSGWTESPTGSGSVISNIAHTGSWILQSDGTRQSPAIGHSGISKNRISFTTTSANAAVVIYLKVSSESNYDFALVGLLDNDGLTRISNYTDRISGETEKNITVNVPSAGSHYIDIAYAKDGSSAVGSDCCFYSLTANAGWWVSKATVSLSGSSWLAGAWSTPTKITGENGSDGAKGDTGPAMVFRGAYGSSSMYYGTSKRVDCVEYNNTYYVARIDAGNGFANKTPTDTLYWNEFGAQFDSIATKLLLAEGANIAGFIFKNGALISQNGTVNGEESNKYENANFVPNILLDSINGNSILKGATRSPFVYFDGAWVTGGLSNADKNNNLVVPGDTYGLPTSMSFPWDIRSNGRRFCLVNYRWGGIYATGKMSIHAPEGKHFFEDGITKSTLTISREAVELLGYGDNTTFYGYIVLNRRDLVTEKRYGRQLKILAQGIVTGTASSASLTNYKTCDGTTLSVSRIGTGHYRITFPSAWGLVANQYIVMLTGYGLNVDGNKSPIKATVYACASTYFDVWTSDDASNNDGSFMFQITNMNDWG